MPALRLQLPLLVVLRLVAAGAGDERDRASNRAVVAELEQAKLEQAQTDWVVEDFEEAESREADSPEADSPVVVSMVPESQATVLLVAVSLVPMSLATVRIFASPNLEQSGLKILVWPNREPCPNRHAAPYWGRLRPPWFWAARAATEPWWNLEWC